MTDELKPRKHAPKGRIKGDPLSPPNPMSTVVVGDTLRAAVRAVRQMCKAHSKQSGKPCGRHAIPGGTVCRWHGGAAPQVQQSALARLMALQHPAIDALTKLIAGVETFPSTAYAAARDVLDRTEGKAIETVKQEHSGAVVIKWESE